MRIRQLLLPCLVVGLLCAGACSDDDPGSSQGGSTTGTTTGNGGTGGGGGGTGATGGNVGCVYSIGEERVCEPPGYGDEPDTQTVGTVTADVVDLQDAPAADIMADLCGIDRCVNATADAGGHVAVDGGSQSFDTPILLYGDGRAWAKMGAPLPTLPNADLGTINTIDLPAMANGVPFALGDDLTSGEVTLTIAADAYIEFNALIYCEAAEQGFRATTVELDGSHEFPAVDDNLDFGMLVATAPIDTTICPAAAITVPNLPGWAPGAAVGFFMHGTDAHEDYAPYGGWARVSTGTVSQDGQTITTTDGEGIPMLGLIGIRLSD